MSALISPLDSIILGIVEGLTEFLPVSSTGHLILTSKALGLPLDDPGVSAYLVVIQAGALLAVAGRYRMAIGQMLRGVVGRDHEGLRLTLSLIVAFLPAAIVGVLFSDWIKERLFHQTPVAAALAAGGVAMIVVDRWNRARRRRKFGVEAPEEHADFGQVTLGIALGIGLAQCLALWPGTSRSMVTIVAAMAFGLSARTSAEFSFLLALPTLGGATVYDLAKEGGAILQATGALGLALGFLFSCVVAAMAIHYFIAWLARRGLEVFGWYRIVLAFVILWAW